MQAARDACASYRNEVEMLHIVEWNETMLHLKRRIYEARLTPYEAHLWCMKRHCVPWSEALMGLLSLQKFLIMQAARDACASYRNEVEMLHIVEWNETMLHLKRRIYEARLTPYEAHLWCMKRHCVPWSEALMGLLSLQKFLIMQAARDACASYRN